MRLVVCIDVDTDDLKEGYARISDQLYNLPYGMTWESTDEAYYGDGTGVEVENLQEARMAHFTEDRGKP